MAQGHWKPAQWSDQIKRLTHPSFIYSSRFLADRLSPSVLMQATPGHWLCFCRHKKVEGQHIAQYVGGGEEQLSSVEGRVVMGFPSSWKFEDIVQVHYQQPQSQTAVWGPLWNPHSHNSCPLTRFSAFSFNKNVSWNIFLLFNLPLWVL